MEHNTVENKNDITVDKVSTSRFIFYVQLFCLMAFMLGGCYNLYKHKYKGKPEVAVPESTLYNPKYK
ncbi:hypothetical protein SAMN05444266_11379 [Chitinophaga jiangningensis]|uniref:Uncharacterized protein n=1 Tax=Chitinophaga jiangningensis TaxID=1419482 RepID=A0A1M7MIC1_9BACT|nr:hypothetical protein [Chitinophaga jiangningensis]SHM90624.1 hypothetical protein SAMN05444266_11379 [Chitinophaga jiangningensis]